MQPLASTSRAVLLPCMCMFRRTMTVSTPGLARKSWFMDQDRKRRQDADAAREESILGPSQFAGMDETNIDLDLVDKATTRSSRESPEVVPWYLQGDAKVSEDGKVDARPWYVEASYEGIPDESSNEVELAPPPPPDPPSHLPESLREMYTKLVTSLWIDPYTVVWVDAHENSDDGAAHTDWIVICTVNARREHAMAGALGEMKQWVRDAVGTLYPWNGRKTHVSVEGYQRRYPDWMLFDGGSVMLHLFSKRARDTWSVEEPYLKGLKAKQSDAAQGVPHPFFSTQQRGPASNADIEGYPQV